MRFAAMCGATALLVLIAGCSGSATHRQTHHTPTSSASSRPRSSPTAPAPRLRVQEWAVNDEMLSVLVQNLSDVEIRSAHAVITARDTHGTIIASVSGASGSLCCTIVGLRPHATFALYADFGPAVQRTASVVVDYSNVKVGAASTSAAAITASGARVRSRAGVTVVDVRLSADSGAGPYVAVQAQLSDSSGKLVATISGRFYCLFPGKRLGATMQLFHPVPAGTEVRRVNAFTIPSDLSAVTGGLPSCTET